MTTAIDITGLRKSFPPGTRGGAPIEAVRGIDLHLDAGEVVAFLGPNGAGKTTTLDMVLGLSTPTSGNVTVFGKPPRTAVHAGQVSAVLQSGGLLADLRVNETVRLVASFFPSHAPVDDVIERAGITAIADRKVSKCSGGEQQRLRFALALLPDPELLILDEPTAGMDVNARREFWATMHAEARSGRTIVFATHYLEEADAFAERIVLIGAGRVLADGPTEDIRARASGRIIYADLRDPQPVAERLRTMRGVGQVQILGDRLQVHVAANESDWIARALLGDLGGRNLEISTGSLESAFVTIVAEANDDAAGSAVRS